MQSGTCTLERRSAQVAKGLFVSYAAERSILRAGDGSPFEVPAQFKVNQ